MGFVFSKPNLETLISYALEPNEKTPTLDKFENYMNKIDPLIENSIEMEKNFYKTRKTVKFSPNLLEE